MYNLIFILLLITVASTCCSQTFSSTRDFTCVELELLLRAPVVLDAFCLSEVKSKKAIRVTDISNFYSCAGTLIKYDRKIIPVVVATKFSVDHNAGYYREVVVNKRIVLEAEKRVELSVYISGFLPCHGAVAIYRVDAIIDDCSDGSCGILDLRIHEY